MPPRRPRNKTIVEEPKGTDPKLLDIYDGPLKDRSFGLRVDDDIEISVIAGNSLINYKGRILAIKDDLELLDDEGSYHKIVMDWMVDIKLIRHNRPLPEQDPEMVKRPVKQKPKKASVDHAYY